MLRVGLSTLVLCLTVSSGACARPPEIGPVAAPEITGSRWFNSKPLNLDKLKGKVVLVEFWTYGCYNCVNVEPHIKRWYSRYHKQGLEVVAVHSPEFAHEKKAENVSAYLKKKSIRYPVVMDNDFAIWRRYGNRYWPTVYLIDRQGQLRYRTIGEGRYSNTEDMIKRLIAETTPTSPG